MLHEENSAHSLSIAYSSSSKLFLEANPDLLKVSCTQIQALARSSKSITHHPHTTQFKYSELSLPNSKVKFLKGSPNKTPLNRSNKKGEPFVDCPFSVSSEKLEHLDRSTELDEENVGTVKISFDLVLQNVMCLPDFHFNFLSISALTSSLPILVQFYDSCCIIQDKCSLKTIGKASVWNGLYHLQPTNTSETADKSTILDTVDCSHVLPACSAQKSTNMQKIHQVESI